MIALPIISILCCYAYVFFVCFKFKGVPVSISETYYLLPPKIDFLFALWIVMTAGPMGFYWYDIAPQNLKWMPIVCVLAMLLIGVSARYKSLDKKIDVVSGDQPESLTKKKAGSFKEFIKELLKKFNPKEFLKYGWARVLHYVGSLVTIGITTAYICINSKNAIIGTILMYICFIIIGLNIPGVYNKNYSADVDNKSWIFFMEVICFTNMFVFFWNF